MIALENIVQAELVSQYSQKITVRFNDASGVLTKLVSGIARLEKREKELLDQLPLVRGWRRKLVMWRLNGIAPTIAIKRQKRKAATIVIFHGTVTVDPHMIAVEQYDRSFRSARKDELDELMASAASCKDVHLFIFKPNYLCSDKLELVAASF